VRPAGPLTGTVTVGGAKNSCSLMAASILAEGTHKL
jgi:UDP-N-acetylglucosamine enolpyruvyl transferase